MTTQNMVNNRYQGIVLQTQQTVKTDTFQTASTSAVDITGMSVSITPAVNTHKVLIMVMISTNMDNPANFAFINLLRGATNLLQGDAGGGGQVSSTICAVCDDASGMLTNYICYLDSPATTSATTYKLQGWVSAGTLSVNFTDADSSGYPRVVSSITAMEVLA